jgi:hypothetical protein
LDVLLGVVADGDYGEEGLGHDAYREKNRFRVKPGMTRVGVTVTRVGVLGMMTKIILVDEFYAGA